MTQMWGARPIPAEPDLHQPVWIDLDLLYGPPSPEETPWPGGHLRHGLVLTGRVPGVLHRWGRAVDGRWVGIVDFTLNDHTGATVVRHDHVAVPAAALTPQDPQSPRA